MLVQSQYYPMVERESSSKSFKSEHTTLLGEAFTTPFREERVYHDKNVSSVGDIPCRLNLVNEINHSWVFRENMDNNFSPRQGSYMSNLTDLDHPIDSEATNTDPKDLFP